MLSQISNFVHTIDGGVASSYALLFGVSLFVNLFFMVLLLKKGGK